MHDTLDAQTFDVGEVLDGWQWSVLVLGGRGDRPGDGMLGEVFERAGHTWPDVIRGRFETAQAGDRSGTRFALVYGASGALTGIPVLISYQPKWWLQVDLVLNS